MRVCSTDFLYHALLNTGDEIIESILTMGLRPLSDFPESERWRQIKAAAPTFFEDLYEMVAAPVLNLLCCATRGRSGKTSWMSTSV